MNKKLLFRFILLLTIFILALLAAIPKGPNLNLQKIGIPLQKELKLNKGLDLQGGVEIVYELETPKDSNPQESQEKAITVIRNRIDAFGVSEPVIYGETFGNSNRIVVQLPGITNIDEALTLIGKTAQLKFKEEAQNADPNLALLGGGWNETPVLDGSELKRADVGRDETGNVVVNLKFSGEGADKFAEATKRNVGKSIGIFLDDNLISAPTVQEEITGGQAKITADFTLKDAKNLAIQLNAGALPVPMKLVQQRNIGATLGEESVNRSLLAGVIGFLAIAIFLVAYYRFLGLLNIFSLFTYTLITLAVFKLFSITLTLPGIAGFILSSGAAAEASVLILERIREEIRKGTPVEVAIETGYKGAWSSVWDSNIVSFLLAIIIFYLGTGLIKGFGVTLAIGVIISILIVIIVDRPMLQFLATRKFIRKEKYSKLFFGVNAKKGK